MQHATITIHLPTLRRDSIRSYGQSWRLLEPVYDGHIGHYLDFLRRQGRDRGFEVRTDQKPVEPAFSIEERDREREKAAREWLDNVPDLWEWIN